MTNGGHILTQSSSSSTTTNTNTYTVLTQSSSSTLQPFFSYLMVAFIITQSPLTFSARTVRRLMGAMSTSALATTAARATILALPRGISALLVLLATTAGPREREGR